MTDQFTEQGITYFACGPSTSKCEHDFSGWKDIIEDGKVRGGTAVCVKCGRTAFEDAMWQ